MEGVLWKWTNYWNGWQTRWFVLENGILSYYKSQEEVNQGCKGSVKVSVCQINVNNIDNTRMDLVIPGQQHMYLRAPSPQHRQKWLVALGSAKACVESLVDTKGTCLEDSLSHKKSELHLYCDLLMQQVHAVKSAANEEGGPAIQKIEDASSLLTATCDTFIRTLEDIMKLTNNTVTNTSYEMPVPNLPVTKTSGSTKNQKPNVGRSLSQESR
ncbi:pleckstrin homology domain-containing family A member 3-like [Maniola jurtina]|uniref:pleckstrin homology domain-containing family A member 3-like n=1 Tax=Maniola jurtina TaxID=191418 RepID=UPI001E68B37C|nr:pleckstrin homology domain-containing family A member 3-like [Maniola jurtina]XP_045785503.1 pleckstrin homology domain-containing family A member 3-like [Maniola jurtina]